MDNKVICICRTVYLVKNTDRHEKSRNHINFMNNPIEIKQIKERVKRNYTICECGSKCRYKNQTWKEAHERSYKHCEYIYKTFILGENI